ncbi:MAG: hypothetical protein RBU25_13675, partial [Lentisphaeria bacterium]|nr:hypothetical protein [Lentisphaeria bacterium]
ESITRQQALRRKKPYVMMSMLFFVLIIAVAWRGVAFHASLYANAAHALGTERIAPEVLSNGIRQATANQSQNNARYQSVCDLLAQRTVWPRLINEFQRHKPEGVWLVSIKPVAGEMRPAVAAATGGAGGGDMFGGGGGDMFGGPSPSGDMPGGGGGDMFGGGGGDMFGGGGAAAGPVETEVMITGFEIIGHSVTFSDVGRAPQGPAAPARAAGPLDDTTQEPVAEEDKVEDLSGTPESIYLTALRKSELFDGDKTYTEFKQYFPPSTVRNLASFVIQVKLKEPVPFIQISGGGRGAAASAMDGMNMMEMR